MIDKLKSDLLESLSPGFNARKLTKIENELARASRAWLSGGTTQKVRDNRETRLAVALQNWLRTREEYGTETPEK